MGVHLLGQSRRNRAEFLGQGVGARPVFGQRFFFGWVMAPMASGEQQAACKETGEKGFVSHRVSPLPMVFTMIKESIFSAPGP